MMLRQLGLSILARAAEFTIHRRFHDDPGSALVRGLRKLEVHIAIRRVDTSLLQKCNRNMEHLKFSPRAWRVGSDEGTLGPRKNGIDANLLRRSDGNRDGLSTMPAIRNVRFARQAFASFLGL